MYMYIASLANSSHCCSVVRFIFQRESELSVPEIECV